MTVLDENRKCHRSENKSFDMIKRIVWIKEKTCTPIEELERYIHLCSLVKVLMALHLSLDDQSARMSNK